MVHLIPAPDWVLKALSPDPTPIKLAASMARHPSQQGFNAFDWLRARADWPTTLDRHDWQVHSTSGGDVYYTRPGKSVREGKSAVLHEDGPLVVFTTEIPETLEGLGHPTADGTGLSFSIVEFICAYEFGGDMAQMGRSITERHGPRQAAAVVRAQPTWQPGPASSAGLGDEVGEINDTPLYPPPEFYEQRPWMAAAAQMAYAVGGSPSAHLLAFLCRWATLIPPGYSIPPINGATSSFDLLCVIAGTSGSGKTSPMRNAARMLPVQRTDLRMSLGIGSGEGVIEAFYGRRETVDDDGKKKGSERAKIIAGVNFAVSEGLIFAELAGRAGTTHVTRLCDAWSGSPLSTANASSETFRHIDEDQYRLTLMMGIQADMAYELMTATATAQGFVGRLLFTWAEEPRVSPRPRPPDPFVLPVPPEIAIPATAEHPKTYTPTYLTYPDQIVTEIQEASDQRVGTAVPVEEHHHDLMRCKVAGIVALMDGRYEVSMDDWAIATTLVDCSRTVREHLRAIRRFHQRDEDHNRAVRVAGFKETVVSERERVGVLKMAENIRDKLQARGPMSKSDLRRMVTARTTRHRLDPALVLAIANGWVRAVARRYEYIES